MKIIIKKGDGYTIKDISLRGIFFVNITPLLMGLIFYSFKELNNIMYYALLIIWLILIIISFILLIIFDENIDEDSYVTLLGISIITTFIVFFTIGFIFYL